MKKVGLKTLALMLEVIAVGILFLSPFIFGAIVGELAVQRGYYAVGGEWMLPVIGVVIVVICLKSSVALDRKAAKVKVKRNIYGDYIEHNDNIKLTATDDRLNAYAIGVPERLLEKFIIAKNFYMKSKQSSEIFLKHAIEADAVLYKLNSDDLLFPHWMNKETYRYGDNQFIAKKVIQLCGERVTDQEVKMKINHQPGDGERCECIVCQDRRRRQGISCMPTEPHKHSCTCQTCKDTNEVQTAVDNLCKRCKTIPCMCSKSSKYRDKKKAEEIEAAMRERAKSANANTNKLNGVDCVHLTAAGVNAVQEVMSDFEKA